MSNSMDHDTNTHGSPRRPHAALGWRQLPVLLLGALLAGCSTLGLPTRNVEPARQYLLDWQPDNRSQAPADAPVLHVSATRAAAGFTSSDLIYIRRPHQLERFVRHRWADSPARMLDVLLVKAAERSGLFSAVTAPGSAVHARLRLKVELLHLQQVFHNGDSTLQLALRASLIDLASGRQSAARTFEYEEPSPATPYGGVQAANRAVARWLEDLTAFLARNVTAS